MKQKRRRWWKALVPAAMMLLLSGCLFRSPDDLYRLPEVPADYDRLKTAIRSVQSELEMEYGTSTDVAVILSGDNTANIQLQDLDGNGLRESAVTFLKVPGVEKSLKVYVFQPSGEDYQVAGVVEGDGASIYSVDYVDLNGTGQKELVVCWQISTGVYQVGAYTLDDLDQPTQEQHGASQRTERLASTLLLTGVSGASDGASITGGYRLLDLDQDTRTEIAVVRIDSGGLNSLLEVYGWKDGAFSRLDSVELSSGISTLNLVRANYLKGELYPPALYVTSTLADGSRIIDVVAYQGAKEERKLVNLSLDPETKVSREVIQGYTDISPTDINDDYVLELPTPTPVPTYGETASTNFWLIDWAQYDVDGDREKVLTTYHNVQDSWYLEIPDQWRDKITLSRIDQISGQREVVFSYWRGGEQTPMPFLSIYRLTGSSRAVSATINGRFVLREEDTVIYAARFYDCPWNCGLDEADLLDRFQTIQSSWYYE